MIGVVSISNFFRFVISLGWILGWGRHVKVLSPPSFVEDRKQELHIMMSAYEE